MIEEIIDLSISALTGYQKFAAAVLDFLTTTITIPLVNIEIAIFPMLFGAGIGLYLGFALIKFYTIT